MIVLGELPESARLLLAIRKQRGWTQGRLARELCVSVRTLRDWEHDRVQPHPRLLPVIRMVLEPALAGSGWAHLAALDQMRRDAHSGVLTEDQYEALIRSVEATARAILDGWESLKREKENAA